jgi:hypothetical protein
VIAVQINIVCDSLTFFPSFYFAKAFKKGPELKNSADQEAYLIVHLDAIYVRQSTLMNQKYPILETSPSTNFVSVADEPNEEFFKKCHAKAKKCHIYSYLVGGTRYKFTYVTAPPASHYSPN